MLRNILLQLIIAFPLLSSAQLAPERESDPRAVKLITEDIPRFWIAFDSSRANPTQTEQIFKTLYFDKGTPGLRELDIQSIKGVKNLALAITKYELYYRSIRANTLKVDRTKGQIIKALTRFKKLYRPARFPNVYFLVGDLNSGGRSSRDGLLIGVEVYCADGRSNFTNIYPPFVPTLKSFSIASIPGTVTHELIHYQQSYSHQELNLLGDIIKEGSADFLSELVTRKTANAELQAYGDQHERELWEDLKDELAGTDHTRWLYNSTVDGRPGNLGYYVGFKIAQAYFLNSKNKKQAISDMLNIKDFGDFLTKSGYEDKFN